MIVFPLSFDKMGATILNALAHLFPVVSFSDEFFYFPQVQLPEPKWGNWDCFSRDTVTEFVKTLSTWESKLGLLTHRKSESDQSDLDEQIDISLLLKVATTLREHLSEVRTWEYQPTFYLTIACLGLAEAIYSDDPAAKHERAEGLPAFLEQASQNLKRVPLLFRDLGLEMVSDTRKYLISLKQKLPEITSALIALDRFEDALLKVSTRDNFLLPKDLVDRIVRVHLNSGMDIQEADHELDLEIKEMQQVLNQEAKRFASGLSWERAYERIPLPEPKENGLIGIYQDEVNRLSRHCLDKGLVSPKLFYSCPVRVAPVPSFLSAIRTASSYSVPPNYPPSGGVFYIINAHMPGESRKGYQREYRMLSAHETYPGHHLLDCSRWSLNRSFRRPIEQPVFYEGWACFAEELMSRTGYFSEPGDRLLLAKRRFWRAIRGKVDLGLQTGAMDIPTAAR